MPWRKPGTRSVGSRKATATRPNADHESGVCTPPEPSADALGVVRCAQGSAYQSDIQQRLLLVEGVYLSDMSKHLSCSECGPGVCLFVIDTRSGRPVSV